MHQHRRRAVTTISAISTAAVITALTGLAVAGVPSPAKGDPQPELAPFNIASSSASGLTTAMLSSGTELVAYYSRTDSSTLVCVLPRAARKCSHIASISSVGASGTPQVIAAGSKDVGLLLDTSAHGEEYYTSTNGGVSFAGPTDVGGGAFGADESVLAGDTVVFSDDQDHDGLQVASFSAVAPTSTDPVDITPDVAFQIGMSSYKSGVLVAYQDASSNVIVYYAKAGSDLTAKASYVKVGTFPNSDIFGMSGSAMVTIQTTGSNHFQTRLFNGSTFGTAHDVPHIHSTIGNWGTVIQDPRGVTHVFDQTFSTPPLDDYRFYEFSTSSGTTWSTQELPGAAGTWVNLSAVLDRNGAGVLVGDNGAGVTPAYPVHAWPILQVAHVSFSLAHASVKTGHSDTATGKGTPAAAGRSVALQRLQGKKWHTIADATETASGKFTFHITEHTAGKYTFRAATNDKAGYVQFGYSSARGLTVHEKKHS